MAKTLLKKEYHQLRRSTTDFSSALIAFSGFIVLATAGAGL
jgi:hypothetical protein